MKNYKYLVPILLVVMFFGSIYMLYDDKATEANANSQILKTARDYRKRGIATDAEAYYHEALKRMESVDLYMEIGDFYCEFEMTDEAIDWGNAFIKAYPEEMIGYEFLLKLYDQQKDYIACFDLIDTVSKRGLRSEFIYEIYEKLEYEHFFTGEYNEVAVFSGGYCPVKGDVKWGYVSQSGGKVIGLRYAEVGPFIDGLAPVVDADGNAYFIDTEGNKKHIVLGVDNIVRLGLIEDGVFSLFDGEKWHFYNSDDEYLFGGYDDVSSIGNGMAAVRNGEKWGLVDRSGNMLTNKTYDDVLSDGKGIVYRNERVFVRDGEKIHMITNSGDVIGTYEDARIFNDQTYAAVKVNGKWGFVDKDGSVVIEPNYEEARSFSQGLAAVKQNGLWGYIDINGEMVLKPQFEDARDFTSKGSVFVYLDGAWTLLRLYKTNH